MEATAGRSVVCSLPDSHRPDLARLADQLKMITVPGGKTLYVWVKEFLDDGDELGGLLADRGLTTASVESAKAAAALRALTIGLLGRLRSAVQDEIAAGAKRGGTRQSHPAIHA